MPSRCHVNSSKGSEVPSAFLRRSRDARYQSQIQGELSSSGARSGSKSAKVPYDRCGGKGTLKITDKLML